KSPYTINLVTFQNPKSPTDFAEEPFKEGDWLRKRGMVLGMSLGVPHMGVHMGQEMCCQPAQASVILTASNFGANRWLIANATR
ncbi:MAG: hypothetical protein NTV46_14650, partial [Verrucomicrobia bacterium]|nr:hypothetical protein [Verrucomicrobiota bacterium]